MKQLPWCIQKPKLLPRYEGPSLATETLNESIIIEGEKISPGITYILEHSNKTKICMQSSWCWLQPQLFGAILFSYHQPKQKSKHEFHVSSIKIMDLHYPILPMFWRIKAVKKCKSRVICIMRFLLPASLLLPA